jgi:hypothetical protein
VTILFAIPVLIGIVGLLAWVAGASFAEASDDGDRFDPERRFGRRGRLVLAGILGFGLAGISALYAGWPEWSTVLVGIAGGLGLAVVASLFGPNEAP